MAFLSKITPDNGHDLRLELEDTVESIAARAANRKTVVRGRLAELENEDAELARVLNLVDVLV